MKTIPVSDRIPVDIPSDLKTGAMSPDLNAILNLAMFACGSAENITKVYTKPFDYLNGEEAKRRGEASRLKGLTGAVRTMWEIGRYWYDALQPVEVELIAASDADKRFGEACAHLAARKHTTRLGDAIWWTADPSTCSTRFTDDEKSFDFTKIGKRFDDVCEAIKKKVWPDWKQIITACQVEAAIAFQSRKSSGRQGRDFSTRSSGRPRKGETGADRILIALLADHHKWSHGGVVENYTPAGYRQLQDKSRLGNNRGISTASISRFFKKKFGERGKKGYLAACNKGAREGIGQLLTKWQNEVPEPHQKLLPHDGCPPKRAKTET